MNDSKSSISTTEVIVGGQKTQVPDYLLKDLGATGLAAIAEQAKAQIPGGLQSPSEPTPLVYGHGGDMAPEQPLLDLLNRPPEGQGLLVVGSGDPIKDAETYGIEGFDKKDLEKLVAYDDAVKAQIAAPSTHRVGTIAHLGSLGGRSTTLGMRSLAAAAMAAIISRPPPSKSEQEIIDGTIELKKSFTDAFKIKDRKQAKTWFRRMQKEDFGAIMLSRLFLPKGTFWYVKDDGTVTGEAAIRWMYQTMEKRDLSSIGKLLRSEVSVSGHKGMDRDMIGYSWSYELFATLLGEVLWRLVENLPETLVNYKDQTPDQVLMMKQQAAAATLDVFRNGSKKTQAKKVLSSLS